MAKVNIYLDDCRKTPEGFIRSYTVEQTIDLLEKYEGHIGILSLDNDLGPDLQEGYKVAEWIEENHILNGYTLPDKMMVHSMNSIARQRMITIINRLYK